MRCDSSPEGADIYDYRNIATGGDAPRPSHRRRPRL